MEFKRLPIMHCERCDQDKPIHLFYNDDGKGGEREDPARLIIRNEAARRPKTFGQWVAGSVGAPWKQEVCYDCFCAFQDSRPVAIEREGTTFYATCAI